MAQAETVRVILIENLAWKNPDGSLSAFRRWAPATMPVRLAEKAIAVGAAVRPDDPRLSQWRQTFGIAPIEMPTGPNDCLDLDRLDAATDDLRKTSALLLRERQGTRKAGVYRGP